MLVVADAVCRCATADSLLTALDKEIHHLRSVSTHEANQLSQYRAQRDEQYARYASAIIPKEKDDRGGSKRGGTRGSAVNMTGDDVLAGVMGGRMWVRSESWYGITLT